MDRAVWLDVSCAEDLFGQRLLRNGVSRDQLRSLMFDPDLDSRDRGRLWQEVQGCGTHDCVRRAIALVSKIAAVDFGIKPGSARGGNGTQQQTKVAVGRVPFKLNFVADPGAPDEPIFRFDDPTTPGEHSAEIDAVLSLNAQRDGRLANCKRSLGRKPQRFTLPTSPRSQCVGDPVMGIEGADAAAAAAASESGRNAEKLPTFTGSSAASAPRNDVRPPGGRGRAGGTGPMSPTHPAGPAEARLQFQVKTGRDPRRSKQSVSNRPTQSDRTTAAPPRGTRSGSSTAGCRRPLRPRR